MSEAAGKLRDLYDRLYEPHKLGLSSESTRRQYRITLSKFATFLDRPPLTTDLTDETIALFMVWRVRRGGAPRTANKGRDNLLALWRFLARKRIVEEWPDVDPIPEPQHVPKAWLRHDLEKLWAACGALPGMIDGVPAAAWWTALMSLIWDTAERIGAVVQVEWTDLDLDGGWVTLRPETRKGHRKELVFPLHPDTVARLRAIQQPRRRLVFPWPYGYTYLWSRLTIVLERAGLPTDRASKFHRLRKSVASHGKAAGIDPGAMLGHTDGRVTAKYIDPRVAIRPYAANVLFRPDRPHER